jgi:hypothetical protein
VRAPCTLCASRVRSADAQVLDSVEGLPAARKSQYAAFVRDEAALIVWADDAEKVVPAAQALEDALVTFLYNHRGSTTTTLVSTTAEKSGEAAKSGAASPSPEEDPEKAEVMAARKLRPVMLISAMISGPAAALAIIVTSLGLSGYTGGL